MTRSPGRPAASSSAGTADLSPIRPRASADARRSVPRQPSSSSISCGHGLAVAPEAGDMDRGLADRLVGIGRERADQRSRGGIGRSGRVQTALPPPAIERVAPVGACRRAPRAECRFARGPARDSIASRCTAGRGSPSSLTNSSRCGRRASFQLLRAVAQGSAISGRSLPAARDRSPPARRASGAARSGSRACTSRRYRR